MSVCRSNNHVMTLKNPGSGLVQEQMRCVKLVHGIPAFYNGIFSDNADINKRYKGR